jgi:hypothetical protein
MNWRARQFSRNSSKLALFVFFCFLPEIILRAILSFWLPWNDQFAAENILASARNARGAIVIAASVGYGIFRIIRRHPAANNFYRHWLLTTPWTAKMPLPLGPVDLRGWDVAFLITAVAVARFFTDIGSFTPLIAFGMAYLVCATLALAITRRPMTIILLFGFGAVLRQ